MLKNVSTNDRERGGTAQITDFTCAWHKFWVWQVNKLTIVTKYEVKIFYSFKDMALSKKIGHFPLFVTLIVHCHK